MTHEAVFQAEKVIPSLIGGTITEAFTEICETSYESWGIGFEDLEVEP